MDSGSQADAPDILWTVLFSLDDPGALLEKSNHLGLKDFKKI